MNIFRRLKSSRLVAFSGIVAAGLLLIPLGASTTFATKSSHLSGCRSDPVIFLSNGNMLDLSATVNTAESGVRLVTYTVHIPTGVKISRIQYTQGFLRREKVVAYADDTLGTYDSATDVQTTRSGVAVSTTGVVVYKSGTKSEMASTSGWSDQDLYLHFVG
ncbi:MAG TPA: hypothetical protein VFB34_00180 [Chloroflexota bacterium]|nr:hypothetical protein [Chloroflexota bacterium]